MTRRALLTCANNFPPQNDQGPNNLSVQYVKREQMPFTLSQDPRDPNVCVHVHVKNMATYCYSLDVCVSMCTHLHEP